MGLIHSDELHYVICLSFLRYLQVFSKQIKCAFLSCVKLLINMADKSSSFFYTNNIGNYIGVLLTELRWFFKLDVLLW